MIARSRNSYLNICDLFQRTKPLNYQKCYRPFKRVAGCLWVIKLRETSQAEISDCMNVKLIRMRRFCRHARHCTLAVLLLSCLPSPALSFDWFGRMSADSPDAAFLEVVEPYIEMHTGPGRGYPIFNVVEQGETIEILKRKPDWYKVKSADNKTGWVKATQLAHTLKPTGVPVDLPEVSHGDYLKSRWWVGFTAGQLEGAETISLAAGYRPFSWAGVGIEGGKIFDESVTSDYYGGSLLVEPMPDWIVTPFLSVGAGKFSFDNRQKVLVDDTGSQTYSMFGAGASYYIGRSFVLRAEYRRYSISTDNGNRGLNAWTIGLNTYF